MAGYGDLLAQGFDIPFSYRLGQYLLGMGDVFGDVSKTMATQSKLGQEGLEGLERTRIAEDTLAERRREADLKAEERRIAAGDRQAKLEAEARRRRAAGSLFATPAWREQTFQVEDTAPATEMGAPNMEVGTPLPILRELTKQRRTTLGEAVQGLGPDMDALTADDLAKAGKVFPDAVLDPTKYAQVIKDIGESKVTDRAALARFILGDQAAAGLQFERPKTEGYTLGPGQIRFEEGQQVASVPGAAPAPSTHTDFRNQAIKNLGPGAEEAAVAAETTRLRLEYDERVARARGDVNVGTQLQVLEERDRLDRKKKADMAERELVGVETLIEKMDALVDKVNTPGVGGRLAGLTTRAAQEFMQSQPDVVNLGNISRSYLSIIAKVVQQQSGILSDQDIKRAERSVPLPTDNLETAKQKVADLKDIVNTARAGIGRLRGVETPPPSGGGGGGGGPKPDYRYNTATGQLELVR